MYNANHVIIINIFLGYFWGKQSDSDYNIQWVIQEELTNLHCRWVCQCRFWRPHDITIWQWSWQDHCRSHALQMTESMQEQCHRRHERHRVMWRCSEHVPESVETFLSPTSIHRWCSKQWPDRTMYEQNLSRNRSQFK